MWSARKRARLEQVADALALIPEVALHDGPDCNEVRHQLEPLPSAVLLSCYEHSLHLRNPTILPMIPICR
jgi:hypothetical protein